MKLLWGIFLCLIFNAQLFPQVIDSSSNYWPLNKENRWYYLTETHSFNIGYEGYDVEEVQYSKDTLINNKTYYRKFSNWFRYNEEENKIVTLRDSVELVFMDFTLSNGEEFIQYNSPYIPPSENQVKVTEFNYIFLNDTIKLKGFTAPNSYMGLNKILYANNIGEVYKEESAAAGYHYNSYSYLVEALIHQGDSTIIYDDKTPPQIIFTPPDSLSDSTFTLRFQVKHTYTIINIGGNPSNKPRHYIDSVKVDYFYQKGDSNYNEQNLICNLEDDRSDFYYTSINLNKELLNDGYQFKYRIIAKDKGLFPEYDIEPDSGFYTIRLITSVHDKLKSLEFSLSQNYPNPFNPATKIKYLIPSNKNPLLGGARGGLVTLKIYDILGNEIATLVNKEQSSGEYEVEFDAGKYNLSSGIYFYQLKAGSFISTKKMILLK